MRSMVLFLLFLALFSFNAVPVDTACGAVSSSCVAPITGGYYVSDCGTMAFSFWAMWMPDLGVMMYQLRVYEKDEDDTWTNVNFAYQFAPPPCGWGHYDDVGNPPTDLYDVDDLGGGTIAVTDLLYCGSWCATHQASLP